MNVKGIIFDFGFTLFDFKEVSMQRYRDAYRRGMRKSIELLKERRNALITAAVTGQIEPEVMKS